MLKKLLLNRIDAFERKTGYDSSWLRDIVRGSTRAALGVNKFMQLSRYRQETPKLVWHVARIAAMRHEDCGPCLQIAVDHALADGVDTKVIETAVHTPENLWGDADLAYRYGAAVAANSADAELTREQVVTRFNKTVLMELALCVATARVYPAIKRGLGHARSCTLVTIDVQKAA